MNVFVEYEPFAPVAAVERENDVLRADVHALCEQLADKCMMIARLEQEIARFKKRQSAGEYRLVRRPEAAE